MPLEVPTVQGWMNASQLQGACALVVGGGSGIGTATARMLAANRVRVMVADRNADQARQAAADIVDAGGEAESVALDLADSAQIDAAVRSTAERFGGIDVLVNTAAFVKAAPLDDGALDEWDQSFRVNVQAALELGQACLPHLKRSERASIVLVASLAGVHGFPRGAGYGPSKAALITLARQMGLEWAKYSIRTNVVIPGSIETPMSSGHHSPQMRALREATIPMRRLGQPEEVASLIQFLASPAASYLTADAYACDGGFSQAMFMSTFGTTAAEEAPPRPVYRAVPMDWMVKSPVRGLAALIVGGGSGIGEATAKTFAANGGLITVADRDMQGAERVVSEIEAAGGHAIAARMDVSSAEDAARAVTATIVTFGRLDALCNLAAMVRPQPLDACSLTDWEACFNVNVRGALVLARACLPHLRQSPAASIVNVGSLGGVWGRPNGAAYGPSKAALMTLSKQMALEWARDGIRVNAVTPGTIDTPLARATIPTEVLRERAAEIPMARLGTSQEMANLIVYLLSPVASYITAQVFNCDGGHAQSMFFAPMGKPNAAIA